jgi:hypothetical protein
MVVCAFQSFGWGGGIRKLVEVCLRQRYPGWVGGRTGIRERSFGVGWIDGWAGRGDGWLHWMCRFHASIRAVGALGAVDAGDEMARHGGRGG